MTRKINIPDYAYNYALEVIKDGQNENFSLYRAAIAIVLALDTELSVDKILQILQISKTTFFRYRREIICSAKSASTKGTWGGRRHSYLTTDEEIAFLNQFYHKAEQGRLFTVNEIHAKLIKLLGKNSLPYSTTTRLLERNGWKRVKPGSTQPGEVAKDLENIPKSQSYWIPPQR